MKIASIDIGSNTVLMLIAEYDISTGKIDFLKNYYRMPRLAKNLDSDGNIKKENINAFFRVLDEYTKIINKAKCDIVLPYATAAMRNAKNSEYIRSEVKKKFGLEIKVIEGNEEAEFSFLGATGGILSEENVGLIDIGGASTEIIVGNVNGIKYKKSFNFGAVKLTDRFFKNDPPNYGEINNLKIFLESDLKEIYNLGADKIIAVAGTPTTLICMKKGLKNYVESEVEGSFLTLSDLEEFLSKLQKLNSKEILDKYGQVVEGRNDVILAGAFILRSIMKAFRKDKIIVSGHGLRYGIIYSYIKSINKKNNDVV